MPSPDQAPPPRRAGRLARWLRFARDYRTFKRLSQDLPRRFHMSWLGVFPQLDDAVGHTPFDRHYIYHCAWAARVLARSRPERHVDIGSSLTFATQVSAFVPIDCYDFRPPQVELGGLTAAHADLCALHFPSDSIHSLSCMHTVEHVGLGRYGDPLDPSGDLRAMRELARVVAPGGQLLFVVPVGRAVIGFNAHRIYAHAQVLAEFPTLTLEEFTLIPDDPRQGGLVASPPQALIDAQRYGCGCYWFRKPPRAR